MIPVITRLTIINYHLCMYLQYIDTMYILISVDVFLETFMDQGGGGGGESKVGK